ncbi:hypothetical protein D3C73_934460 [compost metagenome]
MSLPSHLIPTLQEKLEDLPPELQRAAHWVVAHPAEVGLWSMRRQAQALGVAPATMLRLARAMPAMKHFVSLFNKPSPVIKANPGCVTALPPCRPPPATLPRRGTTC